MSAPPRTGRWRRERLAAAHLYVLLVPELTGHELVAAGEAVMRGGADVVQLRLKSATTAARVLVAERLVPIALQFGALLIVNDDPEAAARAGADGVHVGAGDPSPANARSIVGAERLVGFSTHGMEDLLQAMTEPVDYLAIGAIYPTSTKSVSTIVGPQVLRRVQREIPIKTFAIGGITRGNLAEVIACGGSAVAVSRAILQAGDIAAEARWFKDSLRTALQSGPGL